MPMTAEVFPQGGFFQRGAAAFADCVPAEPADDGFFGPASVTWRLHADLTGPVSGLRSLLLQALHPLAMAGVDQHSEWRDDPGGRFASTAAYVVTTTYGDRAAARAAAMRVRKIHERVTGTDPVTGREYAAGDPALLIWVHAALVDSGLAAANRYGLTLSDADKNKYIAEMTAAPLRRSPSSAPTSRPSGRRLRPASQRQTSRCTCWTCRTWSRSSPTSGKSSLARRSRRRPGARGARRRLPRRARRPRGPPAAHTPDARGWPVSEPRLRVSRALAAMRLAARGGARYAANAPRLFAAAGERRQQLRDDLALRTAQDVADTLGTMKGVLMKIGQLASYVDDGIAPPARRVLSRLQDSVPPMSPELSAGVIEAELGAAPERIFKEWDPLPIAAASIGQVHRAITTDGQAVAVKVQYPGVAETMAADLGNVALIS